MADTDEAAIHLPTAQDSAPQIETDLSDETQDFRFLNHLAFSSDPSQNQSSLPRRGEKDFEPNPTVHQADVLAASRQAMHNALSFPRLHHPKHRVVAFYAPDGPAALLPPVPSKTGVTEEKQQQRKAGPSVHPNCCVYVPSPKGQYFKSMGQADRLNRVWLLPEEALYLLERGSLDIRWPVAASPGAAQNGSEGDQEDEGIPMSLQAAYACLLGSGGLTMERFSVYTGLRRLGYTVIRAPGWDGESAGSLDDGGSVEAQQGMGISVFGRFLQWLYTFGLSRPSGLTTRGPVVGLGIHRSYNDVYRKLALIPYHEPTTQPRLQSQPPKTTPPFRIVFHIYKPSTPVRKSAPPPPDFRIAVINARSHPTIPTVAQLGALLESTPLDPPRGEKMDRLLYMRLRHGYRNVILAVVDEGVVSFLRVGDAAFGREKIYMEKGMQQGGKKGGGQRPRQGAKK